LKNSLTYYTPPNQSVFHSDSCLPVQNYTAKQGMILEGMISPPVPNVVVKATNIKVDSFDGDTEVTTQVGLSTEDGTYKVGPMEILDYSLSAHLEDYEFTLNENGFLSKKISFVRPLFLD
jgi:hypothetical protein